MNEKSGILDDAEERSFRLAEAAGNIARFSVDLDSATWRWSPQAGALFGIDQLPTFGHLGGWQQAIFVDDLQNIAAAVQTAKDAGELYVEFRVSRSNNKQHWLAAKGIVADAPYGRTVSGILYDITGQKELEARLSTLNDALQEENKRAQEEARELEILNETSVAVAAEHNLEHLVQKVTDAGVQLSHAAFGAFFYNVVRQDGEAYMLYTLSGAPREAFSKFPMPRNTDVFEPTFRGAPPVRIHDVLVDSRYGKNPPYDGMPEGHLPVRSYLAASVVSRSGEVLGGLFFGHPHPGIFTDHHEHLITALASQAAVAIENARLHEERQRELVARIKAEEELKQLNRTLEQKAEERAQQLSASLFELEQAERQFRILVEGVTDYAIFMLDPEGNIASWNAGAQRIKGYSPEEAVGRHFSHFYTPEEQASELPKRALATAAATGKYEAEGWRVRKDGSRFWASVVINAIRDSDRKLLGFAKVTRDLTQRRLAEERARQTQRMEAIGQLTGGVAHDFNNLLTIIIGNLETLQRASARNQVNPDQLRRSTENALQGARRAAALTQRLLAFSRQQPLDPKPIDLGRLVTGMSDLLRSTLGEQIVIETVLGGGLWPAYADPAQVELAILNLAVNARDAMPGGGKLTLETANVYLDDEYAAAQAEVLPGQYVMVAVTDNGCGMTPDIIARAFDPFFTTKDIGQGTGLGLSQVYGFVKQSGGHVKIYSEVAEGTTIKMYLPRVHSAAEITQEGSQVPASAVTEDETILVVEDDPGVRAYSCETVAELGYRVLCAEDAKDALRMLETHPEVRLLFTDVGLPGGMNGRQLADEARKRHANLKVLFTTGYARNAIVHNARLDPGVELITKPFTQAALAGKLRSILDSARSPRRILVVEDEPLIQMLATDYLEGSGFKVDTAGSAAEAMNVLRSIPGGADAVIVDMGLPDRRGDHLVREIRAVHPSLPIVIATGKSTDEMRHVFHGESSMGFVRKPYQADDLLTVLEALGVNSKKDQDLN